MNNSPSDVSRVATEVVDATPLISRFASSSILLASIVSAAATLLTTVVAARLLSVEDNAQFLVYWSVVFGVFGVVAGILNETTRAVSARADIGASAPAHQAEGQEPRVVTASVVLGICVGAISVASAPVWIYLILPKSSFVIPLSIALATVLYAVHITLAGALAGTKAWKTYAALSAAESVLRLLAVAVFGGMTHTLLPVQLAVLAPTLTWCIFMLIPTARRALFSRADVQFGRLIKNMLLAMGSAISSAALITGYPALLKLIAGNVLSASVLASMILAITLTRSPLMIPLQAFQGVAISAFVKAPRGTLRPLVKPLVYIGVVGVVGSLVAAAIGPMLITLVYGPSYQVDPVTVGALLIAAIALAWLTLTGTATIAVSAHAAYLAGWLVASIVSLGLLFLPLPLLALVFISLFFGPLCGVAVHLWAIKKAR